MMPEVKRQILLVLVERLRGHIETVGRSPDFERELAKAESELHAIETARATEPAR
jgi:hypothetical protein